MAASKMDHREPDVARVQPSMLSWAIARAAVSREDLAKKLDIRVERLATWEAGTPPPFSKAQALAAAVQVPFGYLYLSEPPAATLPIPDYRRPSARRVPSPEFAALLNDVLVKRDWYREFAQAAGTDPLPFVGRHTTSSSVSDVAEDLRVTIGFPKGPHRAPSWEAYLTLLAQRAESVGVLVMRTSVVGHAATRKISPAEVQGFAISDRWAPVVFVNSSDFRTAQIFTLVHELAHLLLGVSGVGEPDQGDSRETSGVEDFCNRVAAEALVPSHEFMGAWRGTGAGAPTERLAAQFRVSALVILRRARELGLIDIATYIRERERAIENQSSGRRKGRADFYRTLQARMGGRLTTAVLEAVSSGTLPFRDGASLLGVRVPSLVRMLSEG
jgi:Zn-dependent peptidase ImmA (M78 family)/transcriptional regulator with XRE-family HTH domain